MIWQFSKLLRQRCSRVRWRWRLLLRSRNTGVAAVADPTEAAVVVERAAAAEVPARRLRPVAAAHMPRAAVPVEVPAAAIPQVAAAAATAADIPGTRSTATPALRNQRQQTAQIPCLREISNPKAVLQTLPRISLQGTIPGLSRPRPRRPLRAK